MGKKVFISLSAVTHHPYDIPGDGDFDLDLAKVLLARFFRSKNYYLLPLCFSNLFEVLLQSKCVSSHLWFFILGYISVYFRHQVVIRYSIILLLKLFQHWLLGSSLMLAYVSLSLLLRCFQSTALQRSHNATSRCCVFLIQLGMSHFSQDPCLLSGECFRGWRTW